MPLPQEFINRAVRELASAGFAIQQGRYNEFTPPAGRLEFFIPGHDVQLIRDGDSSLTIRLDTLSFAGVPRQTVGKTISLTADIIRAGNTDPVATACLQFLVDTISLMAQLFPNEAREYSQAEMQRIVRGVRAEHEVSTSTQPSVHGVDAIGFSVDGRPSTSPVDNWRPLDTYQQETEHRFWYDVRSGNAHTSIPNNEQRVGYEEGRGVNYRMLNDIFDFQPPARASNEYVVYTGAAGIQQVNEAVQRTDGQAAHISITSGIVDNLEMPQLNRAFTQLYKPKMEWWAADNSTKEDTWKPEPDVPLYDLGF